MLLLGRLVSSKSIPNSRLENKDHTCTWFETKMAKIRRYVILTKTAKKTIPFGAAHTYATHNYKGVAPRDKWLHVNPWVEKNLWRTKLVVSV